MHMYIRLMGLLCRKTPMPNSLSSGSHKIKQKKKIKNKKRRKCVKNYIQKLRNNECVQYYRFEYIIIERIRDAE